MSSRATLSREDGSIKSWSKSRSSSCKALNRLVNSLLDATLRRGCLNLSDCDWAAILGVFAQLNLYRDALDSMQRSVEQSVREE